jgi:hypothetical protein
MRFVLSALALMLVVIGSTQVSARTHKHHSSHHRVQHRHHHHRVRHHHRGHHHHTQRQHRRTGVTVRKPDNREQSGAVASVTSSRPSDCYGIAWCGCWLRHRLGIADKSYNLARNWAGLGRRAQTLAPGVVVVWNHHVGLLQSAPDAQGRALVLSGNDGHRVRERVRSLRGAIAFREL